MKFAALLQRQTQEQRSLTRDVASYLARGGRRPRRVRNPAASTDQKLSYEIESLYKYLSLDDDARDENVALSASYLLEESLREEGWGDLAEAIVEWGGADVVIGPIRRRDPNWLHAWAEKAEVAFLDEAWSLGHAGSAPSFLFFGRPRVVRGAWLIHFTDHSHAIGGQGFTRGVRRVDQVGLTRHMDDYEKSKAGYVFGYLPVDVERHAYHDGRPKYGQHAVVFRADAVVAWHKWDNEMQAIAWGPEAKDMVIASLNGFRPCIDTGNGKMCFNDFPALTEYLDARRVTKQRNPARRSR